MPLGLKMVNKSLAFGLIMILLMASVVFAENEVSSDVEKFVKKIAENRGINQSDIESVTEVDFSQLPEVKIENVDNTNIALYEIKQKGKNSSAFAITLSGKNIEKIQRQVSFTTSFLSFGLEGESKSSTFLETSTGIKTSTEKGYVMFREGSITGMSTILEVKETLSSGKIEVIILKNGEQVGFGNVLDASETGIKKDYDLQSMGIVEFLPGDVISVYIKSPEDVEFKDVIVSIETSSIFG